MRTQHGRLRRKLNSRLLLVAAAAAGVQILPTAAHAQMTFLGSFGSQGTSPGDFQFPTGVAVGPDGTVYVADETNDNVQYFSPTGTYLGTFGTAVSGAYGVAVSANGTVYAPDVLGHVDVFNATGTLEGTFGSPGTTNGKLSNPTGVGISPSGIVYVADSNNNRIQEFSPTVGSATFVSTFGSVGTNPGQFEDPLDVAFSPSGVTYVADTENNRIDVFSSTGVYQSSITGAGGAFNEPSYVAVSATGTVYITDYINARIETFSSSGVFEASYAVGTGAPGGFGLPVGIAVAPTGMVYVADSASERIDRFFDPSAWVSGTNSFTNFSTGPISVGIGPTPANDILGDSLTLNSTMALAADNVSVAAGGSLTEAGGGLSVTASFPGFGVGGNFTYESGAFSAVGVDVVSGGVFQALQGGALPVSELVTIGGRMALDGGAALTTPLVTLNSGGLLQMNNANVSATNVNILTGGEIEMLNSTSSVITAPISNAGLLIGAGQINGALSNGTGGQVSVNLGQSLMVTGSGSTNAGLVSVGGGMLQFTQSVTNQATGTIEGFGSLYFSGGLNNSGTLGLAGSTSVSGSVTNNASGLIHLLGSTPNVFVSPVANAGTLTIDAGASGTFYGPYTGAGPIKNFGSVYFNAASISGTITGNGNLNIGNQSLPTQLQFAPLGGVSQQASLTLSTGSLLDITNNSINLNYGSLANDPIATIKTELANGYAGGAWTGTSSAINSSTAAAAIGTLPVLSIGYSDGNVDNGTGNSSSTSAVANQVVVKFTLAGDANLDGIVNFNDLDALGRHLNTTGNDWANGNFNYDPNGVVNFNDLDIIGQNLNKALGALGSSTDLGGTTVPLGQVAQTQNSSVVPEPSAILLAAGAAAGLLARRRRNKPQRTSTDI
jgi:hypothetical protein